MVDIPNNNTTTATVTVGGPSVNNTLEVSGDHDWFKLTLTQGQAVTVSLNGTTLQDPYLRILNSAGTVIYENDDINLGVNLDSLISFAAPSSGTYYIDVGSYEDPQTPGGTGNYQLTVTPYQAPPVWTNDQIATQLASGYWGDGVHKFILDGSRQLTFNITGLTVPGQNLARQALQTWSDITGISFVETSSINAQIMFTDDDPDGGAFTESQYSGANITSSHVNVDASWLQQYGATIGSYAFQAYIHEIGHALGLGHAGNYNTTADYPYDALFSNDAWSTSVMSYFSQTDNSYFSSQGFTDAHDVTPMVADILAMQQLYGLSSTTRSGNTTYGFNSNAGVLFDASQTTHVAYTIFDTGGTDTLDYSDYFFVQKINLNPETFSNVGGEVGNVTIARGTIIENAIGGDRADVIIGNSIANMLTGNQGSDTLTGGSGNDTFSDTVSGHQGDTITDLSVGDKIVFTDATLAGFAFNLSGSTLTYSGGSLTLSAPIGGTLIAGAAAGGGVQLTIQARDVANDFNGDGRSEILWGHSGGGLFTDWLGQGNGGLVDNSANLYAFLPTEWYVAGTGDFNGDSRDDVLWGNSGNVSVFTDWLGQANGTLVDNSANLFAFLPAGWRVAGTGDFNGDGRDDVLWQNVSSISVFTDWLGQANGSLADNSANFYSYLGPEWHVAGTGDFNGDGRDDILWQRDGGLFTSWLGQANGGFVDNSANFYAFLGPDWQVAGTGDFNGDGRDDILWGRDGGVFTNWLAQGNGSFVDNSNNFFAFLGAQWHAAGTGDYNGDGRDDVLWGRDGGLFTNWLGQANGGLTDNSSNFFAFLGTQWHSQPDHLF